MKKVVAIFFVLLLLGSLGSMALAAEYSVAANKIAPELTASLRESDSVLAVVEMQDVDHDAVMDKFEMQYPEEYAVYMAAKNEAIFDDDEEIDSELLQRAIELKRELYSQAYFKNNFEIIDECFDDSKQVYVSAYSPVAIVETDAASTWATARNKSIVSISEYFVKDAVVDDNVMYAGYSPLTDAFLSDIELSNQITRADYVRDTLGFDGEGVKIGIVEFNGLPAVSNPYLRNATIITDPNCFAVDIHATQVAAIIVASDPDGRYIGVAPEAELYCTAASRLDTFLRSVEWLIESGVNVINVSAAHGTAQGTYDPMSAWVDHIAVLHDVHFVKSAGNKDGFITMPGMAYNAITVGGFLANGTDDITAFERFTDSNYQEFDGECPQKPNLVANCSMGGINGTSAAAPQVTGVIAQLCTYNPFLKIRQTAVGAVLMASAAEKVDAAGSGYKGDIFAAEYQITPQISEWEGAGILDALWAINILANGNDYTYSVNTNGGNFVQTVSINASINTVNRVALFWLKKNTVSYHSNNIFVSGDPLTNLDLYVYGPDGNLIGSSTLPYNNYEIVQFVPEETGTYTIVITGFGNKKEHIGIALW